MKAQNNAVKQVVAQPVAQIVDAANLAKVEPSGIANVNNRATDAQMAQFVGQIRQGKPTGKIFPAKLSEMEFTYPQRLAIAEARKFHKQEAIKNQKSIAKLIGDKKNTIVLGHRTNHDGNKGRVGYALKSAFLGKDGKFSPDKLARFIEGPKIKPATA